MYRNESILGVLRQLHRDVSVIIGFVDSRSRSVANENDTRPCTYFGCPGTQRFTTIVAPGGMPGWECSEERAHAQQESRLDFTAQGRATRIDAILKELRLLEQEAAGISTQSERDVLNSHIRAVIARVRAERNHIEFPNH
jgi:hypothetical protein